ncbi:hypothetical protein [Alkalicoccus chagannorensis]|uniref:hypothetical protein n=1 Tax=Alkalicoccus chagannorensis TaxID=427072 RepID=UPI00047B185B|nr:hypothetical protein [Alkalicoccus chagannorensis]
MEKDDGVQLSVHFSAFYGTQQQRLLFFEKKVWREIGKWSKFDGTWSQSSPIGRSFAALGRTWAAMAETDPKPMVPASRSGERRRKTKPGGAELVKWPKFDGTWSQSSPIGRSFAALGHNRRQLAGVSPRLVTIVANCPKFPRHLDERAAAWADIDKPTQYLLPAPANAGGKPSRKARSW